MKTMKAEDILTKRFGKPGTEEREKFREEAYSYYFGEIIKSRRKELQLNQEQLAKMVGKKISYISRMENGEDIRLSNLILVAKALNLSLQLISEDDNITT